MTSKVSTLLRAPGVEDPGRVDGAGTERPDPEVPERAKRRTFTAKYKLEVLAEYDAAPDGEKGVCYETRDYLVTIALIEAGLGIALVPRTVVRQANRSRLSIRELSGPTPARAIYAVHHARPTRFVADLITHLLPASASASVSRATC